MPPTPEIKLRLIAENFARQALEEAQRSVEGLANTTKRSSPAFGDLIQKHVQLGVQGRDVSRGMALTRGALQQLATQATGASGPIAKLATGLLTFGAGSTIALAVVAGIGAIIGVYKLLRLETEAETKANEELLTSLRKIGPLAAQLAEAATLRNKLRDIDKQIAETRAPAGETPEQRGLRTAGLVLRHPRSFLPGGGGEEAVRIELEGQRQAIVNNLARLEEKRTKELDTQREKLGQQYMLLTLMYRTTGQIAGLGTGVRGLTADRLGGRPDLIPPTEAERGFFTPTRYAGGPAALRGRAGAGPKGARTVEAPDLIPMEDAINSLGETSSRVGETMVASFGKMAEAAIRGSDQMVGAVIGGFGQILHSLTKDPLTGSILGAGLGILGALFGGGRSHEPVPVKVTNVDEVRGERGQATLQVLVNGQVVLEDLVENVLYQMGRRTRLDAVPRVPRS